MAERSKQRGKQGGEHTQRARQEPHVPVEAQKTMKGAPPAEKSGKK